jgi:hypothetical protein
VFASIAEIALAAPLGFAVGFVVGLFAANRWILVRRARYRVEPRDEPRDYNRDRG